MSNVTIFKKPGAVATGKRELSALAKSLASGNNTRKIVTTKSGTFKRRVGGELMPGSVRGELEVIIANTLPKVSRVYYPGAYDPDATPSLPDCWSDLGDKPDPAAGNPQSVSCTTCKQNIAGSGDRGGRACRFKRNLALLVPALGDEVYQFGVPSMSLFGKGVGNTHPFENYVKFLIANGESPDNVVTSIAYADDDENPDVVKVTFTPVRGLTDDEYESVVAVQAGEDAKAYVKVISGVVTATAEKAEPKALPKATPVADELEEAPAKATFSDEPEDEPEPVKRTAKKKAEAPVAKKDLASVISAWGDGDD